MTAPHASSHTRPVIPRELLIACGALMLFSVVITGLSVAFDIGRTKDEIGAASVVRPLVFADTPEGGIDVIDLQAQRIAFSFAPNDGGFVRTAMRALAHKRRVRGVGAQSPFTLIETTSGRLVIADPETGAHIGLEAFGKENAAQFRQLLTAGGAA